MINWLKQLFGVRRPAPQLEVKKENDSEIRIVSTSYTLTDPVTTTTITLPVEVQAVNTVDVVAAQPEPAKKTRKPRAKKETTVTPLPQTVKENVEEWPFPSGVPEEGPKKRGRKKKVV